MSVCLQKIGLATAIALLLFGSASASGFSRPKADRPDIEALTSAIETELAINYSRMRFESLQVEGPWAWARVNTYHPEGLNSLYDQSFDIMAHWTGEKWIVAFPGDPVVLTWLQSLSFATDLPSDEVNTFAKTMIHPQTTSTGRYYMPYPLSLSYTVTGDWDDCRGWDTQGNCTYYHQAIDFGLDEGDAVLASLGGQVSDIKRDSTACCGDSTCANDANFVKLYNSDAKEYSLYYHLRPNSIPSDISIGGTVVRGQKIGEAGHSGWTWPACAGNHLHFEVRSSDNIRLNPYFIEKGGTVSTCDAVVSQNADVCCGCLSAACCGAATVSCDLKSDAATGAISFRNLWPSAPDHAPRALLPSPIPGPADTFWPAQATPAPTAQPPPTAAAPIQAKTAAENNAAGGSSRLTDTSPPNFEIVTAELPWTNDSQLFTFAWAAAVDDGKVAGYRVYWGDDAQGTGSVAVEQARYEPGVTTNNDTAMVRYLRAAAEDAAGNLSAWKTIAIWRYDPIPPGLSLSIGNGDPVVPTLNVTLNLVADDRGSGISKARFSQDGSNWTQWEPYAPYRAWQLEDKPDSQTVYAQVKDAAGNLSGAAQASVTAALNVELPSSTSYRIARSVLGMGGGAKTSASYRVQGTSGQLSGTGVLAGGSYRVRSGFWAGVTCPLAELAAAPNISADGGIVALEWDAVAGVSSYRIYRGTEPYFVLGTPYDTTSNTTWTDSDGGGTPSVNHTYVVKAVNGCGESSTLYRVGEFKFALTPGN